MRRRGRREKEVGKGFAGFVRHIMSREKMSKVVKEVRRRHGNNSAIIKEDISWIVLWGMKP